MFSKTSPPYDCNLSRPPAFGMHFEESSQAKLALPKLPQEAPREVKMEATKSPGRKISELLQGKEEEWAAGARRAGPLRLLDLPLDLLGEILREVSC